MADNSKGKKKTVIVSLLTFLLLGGGVFLFFIIQGSNDLTGPKNKNFHYGSIVRGTMVPFFRSIGVLGEDEEALSKAAAARIKSRGILPEEGKKNLDMSDWMNKGPGGGVAAAPGDSGSRASASASARAPSAPIARMNAQGGGLPTGGGGTQSSGGASRFGEGGQSGNTRITAGSSGTTGAGGGKGTLASLRGAQALLSSGLRSGSAMTAKSKWDKSFGVSAGGHGGGEMAYGKQGMISLDTIKSGEIGNLKTTGTGAVPAASVPELDKEGTAKSAEINKAKDAAQDLAKDVAKSLVSDVTGAATDKPGTTGAGDKPPSNVVAMGEKPAPEGVYCPQECSNYDGSSYKDNAPTYEKKGNNWAVTYTGEQKDLDGNVTFYKDECIVNPNSEEIVNVRVSEGSSANKLVKIPL